MSKFLKNFKKIEKYNEYITSDNFISPNVSLYFYNHNKTINFNTSQKQKYEQLEYISSTQYGGQYIDLGCKLLENTDDIRIDIKYNIRGFGKDDITQSTLIACQDESNNSYPGFTLRTERQSGSVYVNTLKTKWSFTESEQYSNNNYLYTGLSYGSNYTNNTSPIGYIYEFSVTLDNIPQSQIINNTCTLFCAKDKTGNPFRFVKADLYYLKLYKGGILIRDLVPMKKTDTKEIGLYDKANDHFYTSQGDNPFVEGII